MKTRYILILLLLTFFACKTKETKEELKVDVVPQKDTIQVAIAEPVPEPVKEIVDEGVSQDHKYFLVINSYTVKEIGEKWNKVYRERGFNSDLVMKRSDGFYRLALKSFNDVEQAKKALDEMKKEEEFSELWIMVK